MPELIPDSAMLHYVEAGAGDPALVCVHGWCCNSTHFAPQLEHFAATHRVISVDLPGHGGSDAPTGETSIAGFADDIAGLCGALGLKSPVIIGHSMGGAIALSIAAQHPQLASAIIMLDGALLQPAALRDLAPPLTAAFDTPDFLPPLSAVIDGMFMDTDDPDQRARIKAEMLSIPQVVMSSEWKAVVANDWAADAKACTVPALYIGSYAPIADMSRLKQLMPTVMLAQTAGAGHFHQLEVPDQINPMIERFLATVSSP